MAVIFRISTGKLSIKIDSGPSDGHGNEAERHPPPSFLIQGTHIVIRGRKLVAAE